MISLEKARDVLDRYVDESLMTCQKTECVSLWEAGGRVLAGDLISREDVPAFHRSRMDGYAILSSDIAAAAQDNPIMLRIIDTIAAGSYSEQRLSSGAAMKIFTGAPMPPDADCVVKQEDTEEIVLETGLTVVIKKSVSSGENISFQGEDIRSGETLYPGGSVVSFAMVEILAALGVDPVAVLAKPRIGVFSTGNELIDLHQAKVFGKIRPSNLYALAEIIRMAGGAPVNLGVVRDQLDDILNVYEQAEQLELPIVISTGGTASGDFDLIKQAMERAGSTRLFNKIAIRPGARFVASGKKNQLLAGLSGNPGGAIITAFLLLAPIISRLEGANKRLLPGRGKLTVPVTQRGGLRKFFWGCCDGQSGEMVVTPLGKHYPNAAQRHITGNCLIEIPAGEANLVAGDDVVLWKFC